MSHETTVAPDANAALELASSVAPLDWLLTDNSGARSRMAAIASMSTGHERTMPTR